MKIKTKKTVFVFLCYLIIQGLPFSALKTVAQDKSYTLSGLVTDESDNWINEAIVTLEPIGINVLSDANGNFLLEVDPKKLKNSTFNLQAEKVGYLTAKISIDSLDIVEGIQGIVLKMESNPIDSDIIGFTVEMEPSGNFAGTLAQFHVFVPESADTIKAALYISRHGMGNISNAVLQQFAEEERVALVGMFGDPVQRGVDDVAVLDVFIDSLSKLSGHPELSNVPVMTFGHSNGTGFSASWPRDRPDRTIAWVSYHPGFSNYLQYTNTEKVPSMVMLGSIDKYLLRSRQDTVVAHMRKTRNAAMCAMMEGGIGHGPSDVDATWAFITEFYKSAMRLRLADDGTLKPIQIDHGWLGEIYNFEEGGRQLLDIASYENFTDGWLSANWFPDEEFARHWQCYGLTAGLCANSPFTINFKLIDGTSRTALDGVRIYLKDTSFISDNKGDIVLELELGNYTYSMQKTGYTSLSGSITATRDAEIILQMVKKKYHLLIEVRDSSTNAIIPGAIFRIDNTLYESDEHGHCSMILEYGDYMYRLSKDGYDQRSDSMSVSSDSTLTLLLSATPNATGLPPSIKMLTYPNPVIEILTIETSTHSEQYYEIYDITGELIRREMVTTNKVRWDVRGLSPGIYFIQVKGRGRTATQKILKR